MEIKPTGSKICYTGLKVIRSGHNIPANGKEPSYLQKHFTGLTPTLFKLMPWKDRALAEKIEAAGTVKVPSYLLRIGMEQIKLNDPVHLLNPNDYTGVIPSTFVELQDVMNECFSLTEKSARGKFGAGTLHFAVGDHVAKGRGVIAWLDDFKYDPGCLSVFFSVRSFRGSLMDQLDMCLPLKNIRIVDTFKMPDIPENN